MQNNDFIEGSNDEPNYNADPPVEMEAIDVNFSYDGFQVVRGEFFAHIYEPSITFNKRKVYLNTACIKKFPEIDYVQILVNSEEKKLAVRPCSGEEKDSLDKRLKAMCDKHLISEKEQAVLLKTKDIGNSSAHEGKSLDAYEVEAALIIVEFLLKKIYLLPAIQRDLERGKEKFSIDEVFGDESPEVVINEQ